MDLDDTVWTTRAVAKRVGIGQGDRVLIDGVILQVGPLLDHRLAPINRRPGLPGQAVHAGRVHRAEDRGVGEGIKRGETPLEILLPLIHPPFDQIHLILPAGYLSIQSGIV